MKKNTIKRIFGIILALSIMSFYFSPQIQYLNKMPSVLNILKGQSQTYNVNLPLYVKINTDNESVLNVNGNSISSQNTYDLKKPIEISSNKIGNANIHLSLFGLIPIKDILIKVFPDKVLIPGGNSIGVTLYTKGALVVGMSYVTDESGVSRNPASDAGIMPGDIIEKVKGVPIKNADHLAQLINEYDGKPIEMEIRRKNVLMHVSVQPVQDTEDKKYRLGVWVRDSTAGVGTMTFYDPKTNKYGALGHAITDMDTGSLLKVKNGEIMESKIIDIKQGEKGKPGELKGIFLEDQKNIGNIETNNDYGIYGTCYDKFVNTLYKNPIPIGMQNSVHEGQAEILTTIDNEGIKKYKINIIRVNHQNSPASKSMVIKVTDKELLKRTGGIVQGMSGSPIIQDGKIIGAVTHVFVNDPTKGYGLFIEWMMKQIA